MTTTTAKKIPSPMKLPEMPYELISQPPSGEM